jgi:hypothetical protein
VFTDASAARRRFNGPWYRSRLLPSVVGARLRLRNDEAHPLLIDRFAGLAGVPSTASRKVLRDKQDEHTYPIQIAAL